MPERFLFEDVIAAEYGVGNLDFCIFPCEHFTLEFLIFQRVSLDNVKTKKSTLLCFVTQKCGMVLILQYIGNH